MPNTYYSEYRTAPGQPANGYEEHTSKRAAIKRARALKANLPRGGRGTATAGRVDRSGMSNDVIYRWFEHPERGYRVD